MASFQNRVIGALTLQASTFEEVENDASATSQAAIVVVAAAVSGALASVLWGSVTFGVLQVVGGLVAWAIGSFVILLVGTKIMPGKNTNADYGQMLRVLGFAQAPNLGAVIAVIPLLGWLIAFLLSLWALVASVVGVKAALDYDDTIKAVIVCIIAWVIMFLVMMMFAMMAGGAALMTGAALSR